MTGQFWILAGISLLLLIVSAWILYRRSRPVQEAPPLPKVLQIEQVNNLLPQTQCGLCGYGGCRPYARAVVEGTPINQCPPGGQTVINELAQLLNVPVVELNPAFGEYQQPRVAIIREEECIGCTKCIQVCPTDAILGSARHMHTVIESDCTGCKLCIEPCPVDCIDILELDDASVAWALPEYRARQQELPAIETVSS